MDYDRVDEVVKAAVEESVAYLVSVVRDREMPQGDRLEAAAILLRYAPFTELGCLEFDLGYIKRSESDSR